MVTWQKTFSIATFFTRLKSFWKGRIDNFNTAGSISSGNHWGEVFGSHGILIAI